MSKFEPTFALRKKNATDTIGRVCAFINYTLKKGESKMYYFTMKDLTTGKPFKVPVSVWDKKNNRCFIKGSVAEKEYYQSINAQIKEIVCICSEKGSGFSVKRGPVPKTVQS